MKSETIILIIALLLVFRIVTLFIRNKRVHDLLVDAVDAGVLRNIIGDRGISESYSWLLYSTKSIKKLRKQYLD